jgi:hypothetical protein
MAVAPVAVCLKKQCKRERRCWQVKVDDTSDLLNNTSRHEMYVIDYLQIAKFKERDNNM